MELDQYRNLSGRVRLRVLQFARDHFRALGRWRAEDITTFVEAVTPVVAAGQRTIGALTDAFLSAQLAATFGGSATPIGIDPEAISGAETRNGTPPAVVYARPFDDVYGALHRGASLQQAVNQGVSRLDSLVNTDMQLARTHAARARFANSRARAFRRQLGGGDNCALCIVASTQSYRVENLMPIHPGCQCTPVPVRGPMNRELDRRQLEEIHNQVAAFAGESDRGGRAPDYRQILVTREHGEYGPTLSYRNQKFTGPNDLP